MSKSTNCPISFGIPEYIGEAINENVDFIESVELVMTNKSYSKMTVSIFQNADEGLRRFFDTHDVVFAPKSS